MAIFCVELFRWCSLLFLLSGMCSGSHLHKAKQTLISSHHHLQIFVVVTWLTFEHSRLTCIYSFILFPSNTEHHVFYIIHCSVLFTSICIHGSILYTILY